MKRILIVDDDDGVRTSLAQLLKEVGYQTQEVSSGAEAMETISSADFDVVLLDITMPGMNGVDTLSELKKINPKTPVIMITAFPSTDSAVDTVKRGASDYISKPFKVDELVLKINRTIEETRIAENIKKLPFPNTMSSLSNPLRRQIVGLLSSKSGIHLMEIVRELDISDHTKVSFHLRILKEERMIKQDKEKAYALTEEGKKTLAHLNFLENYFSK